jgi:2-polyprenyl-6-methoxyphenol hydroxylase-like FAD-dependent oxidoreductase
MKKTHIIIAGAGPVGVVAALACAQQGYAVTLLEAEAKIDDSPRAATTHPSTLEMIARVGLIEQFIGEGLVARYFQFWDKPARASRRVRSRSIARRDPLSLRGTNRAA